MPAPRAQNTTTAPPGSPIAKISAASVVPVWSILPMNFLLRTEPSAAQGYQASNDIDQRTPVTQQGELMVSRALYPGALHHQSLSGEDAERYAERLHDAIKEAASTFPRRTQRKPGQRNLHDIVKKRGMTGAELAEKSTKKNKPLSKLAPRWSNGNCNRESQGGPAA
ncbi:hypothetical protein FN846DRAFT_895527 [Sphaerosporella brunnea]|uniref:Uncharacterized protein n=1 Tax=Sphaerosporella brunnea TaxID=1250544 RepID=A0A5J5EFU2_9PEZI|nr:hypothetical protein FN846DRAFT_895527 [Sphaerosporella brunnea]